VSNLQLILGTAQFDNNYGISRANQIDQNSAEFILNLAYQLGIRIIDTSMDYGNAHQFLCENKNVFTIQTKVKSLEDPAETLNTILSQLNLNIIDLIYIHDSSLSSLNVEHFRKILSYQGVKYKKLGISVYTKEEFINSVAMGIFQVIQIPLNLLDRRIDSKLREKAKNSGIEIMARSIFLQGILAKGSPKVPHKLLPIKNKVKIFEDLSNLNNMSLIEFSIRWAMSQEYLDGLVIGVESGTQLMEIVDIFKKGALAKNILSSADEINLDEESLIDPRSWEFI
jgi:aryl-alcohol dehydrogenase-like predicted oxidoreductase